MGAATVSPREARRRMRSMRRRVREYDVAHWAAAFLDALNQVPDKASRPPVCSLTRLGANPCRRKDAQRLRPNLDQPAREATPR